MVAREWEISFVPVYREANSVADGLANLAFELQEVFSWFSAAPESVELRVLGDVLGVASLRNVAV